jgi:two-component system response regulator CpxR
VGDVPQGNLKRVLLIDDHDDTRELIAYVLGQAGYSVLQACHGQQGLDVLVAMGHDLPCLILLDLQMPVMSGWEFLTIVQSYARLAAIPVLIMSGTLSGGHAPSEALRQATVTGYLPKPVNHTELLDRLKQVVAEP